MFSGCVSFESERERERELGKVSMHEFAMFPRERQQK